MPKGIGYNRKKLSRKKSKRDFRNKSGINKRNTIRRGGIRL